MYARKLSIYRTQYFWKKMWCLWYLSWAWCVRLCNLSELLHNCSKSQSGVRVHCWSYAFSGWWGQITASFSNSTLLPACSMFSSQSGSRLFRCLSCEHKVRLRFVFTTFKISSEEFELLDVFFMGDIDCGLLLQLHLLLWSLIMY